MELWQILIACGVPSGIFGLLFAFITRKWIKSEKAREEQQQDIKNLTLMMLQGARANTVLCIATAEAVRDGHCNGNMTNALATVQKAAEAEKTFLIERGIKFIFD